MVLDLTQAVSIVRALVARISTVVAMAAIAVVLGGLLVMAASVLLTRSNRVHECAILKAQGATRGVLMRMVGIEYFLLGGAGAAAGSAAAAIGARVIVRRAFEVTPPFEVIPLVAAIALGGAITLAVGAAASAGVLGRPPLVILRSE
jgi:putative ABC transport system permease protein